MTVVWAVFKRQGTGRQLDSSSVGQGELHGMDIGDVREVWMLSVSVDELRPACVPDASGPRQAPRQRHRQYGSTPDGKAPSVARLHHRHLHSSPPPTSQSPQHPPQPINRGAGHNPRLQYKRSNRHRQHGTGDGVFSATTARYLDMTWIPNLFEFS